MADAPLVGQLRLWPLSGPVPVVFVGVAWLAGGIRGSCDRCNQHTECGARAGWVAPSACGNLGTPCQPAPDHECNSDRCMQRGRNQELPFTGLSYLCFAGDPIVLSGGCALNVKLAAHLCSRFSVPVHVPPDPSDGGNRLSHSFSALDLFIAIYSDLQLFIAI
jgi:hypothetical protein